METILQKENGQINKMRAYSKHGTSGYPVYSICYGTHVYGELHISILRSVYDGGHVLAKNALPFAPSAFSVNRISATAKTLSFSSMRLLTNARCLPSKSASSGDDPELESGGYRP
jgi:hypothetical protein